MERWEELLREHVEEAHDSEWQDVEKALKALDELRKRFSEYVCSACGSVAIHVSEQ